MNPLEEEIERIRDVRRRISGHCGDDPHRLVDYYRQFSAKLRASGRYKFARPVASSQAEATGGMVLHDKPPSPPK